MNQVQMELRDERNSLIALGINPNKNSLTSEEIMKNKVVVGSVVAFNDLKDATWFDVTNIRGFRLTVREHGTDYSTSDIDISYVKKVKK